MRYRLFLASSALILSFNLFIFPSLAKTASNCDQYEEIFAFQIPNYATQLQSGAILNIKVAYRLTPEAIAKNTYPNFIPIKQDIDQFLVNYPSKGDFWEIVNKKLVKSLLDKYPQMSSLTVEIDVSPTPKEISPRSSIVHSTRPNRCPLSI